MSKYTEYDAALLKKISEGKNTLNALEMDKVLADLGKPLLTKDRWGSSIPNFRLIDRRLQALRKAGQIIHQDKRWSIVK